LNPACLPSIFNRLIAKAQRSDLRHLRLRAPPAAASK
jgi:hypothetical protein